MAEFFNNLTSTWWGILSIVLVSLVVWTVLSALLYKVFFKRFYDILLSFLAIVFSSPVMLILIIVGAIKMKGNPFFVQRRPGKDDKIFSMLKFRTMTCEKDKDGNFLPDEVRLTRYGRLLRSTSLDELPEFFNVFVGQMSFVGPRPQLIKDLAFMDDNTRRRHNVRGGLTGLAQVMGRNNITWDKKFEYDLEYINKISLWLDIKIILLTVLKVLKRSDVERDGTVSDIDYGDWLVSIGRISQEEFQEVIKGMKRN